MAELSKHDIHKLFMKKAANEVSPAELMAVHSVLSEAIPMCFGHRKYGHLANVLTVNVSTTFDTDTALSIIRNLKEAIDKVAERFEESLDGSGRKNPI